MEIGNKSLGEMKVTRPSSPRGFFARIYGHLESTSELKLPFDRKRVNSGEDRQKVGEKGDSMTRENVAKFKKVEKNDVGDRMVEDEAENQEETKRTQVNIGGREKMNEASEDAKSSGAKSGDQHPAMIIVPLLTRPPRRPDTIKSLPIYADPRSSCFVPSYISTHRATPTGLAVPRAPELHFNGFSAFLARRRRKQETRPRRQRTTFNGQQTAHLESEYQMGEYISRGRRFELAASLALTETQIKIWFQNRRAKDKRIEKAQLDQHYRNLVATNGLSNISPFYNIGNDSCRFCVGKNINETGRYNCSNCAYGAQADSTPGRLASLAARAYIVQQDSRLLINSSSGSGNIGGNSNCSSSSNDHNFMNDSADEDTSNA